MSTLVIAEHDNSNLKPSTLNTLAAAKAVGDSVHLLVAGKGCESVANECAAVEGVEKSSWLTTMPTSINWPKALQP